MTIVNIDLVSRLFKEQNPTLSRGNVPNVNGGSGAPDQAEHIHTNGVGRDNMFKDGVNFLTGSRISPIRIFPNFVKVGTAFHLRNIS